MKIIQLDINGKNHDIAVKEHCGQRVVTLKDVDELHQRPDGTARKRFNDNKSRFVFGEDYFVRNMDEAREEYGITAPNGLVLITEQGYLMLVKSLTDELAWTVQRQLVNSYFRVKNEVYSVEDVMIHSLKEIKSLKQKVDHQDERQSLQEYELGRLKLVVDNEVWLAEHQKQNVQSAVNRRVRQLNDEGYSEAHYQTIYGALKRHFGVAKYDKIPRKEFETAMRFVAGWYPPTKQRSLSI
jgi:hypothetical protein